MSSKPTSEKQSPQQPGVSEEPSLSKSESRYCLVCYATGHTHRECPRLTIMSRQRSSFEGQNQRGRLRRAFTGLPMIYPQTPLPAHALRNLPPQPTTNWPGRNSRGPPPLGLQSRQSNDCDQATQITEAAPEGNGGANAENTVAEEKEETSSEHVVGRLHHELDNKEPVAGAIIDAHPKGIHDATVNAGQESI